MNNDKYNIHQYNMPNKEKYQLLRVLLNTSYSLLFTFFYANKFGVILYSKVKWYYVFNYNKVPINGKYTGIINISNYFNQVHVLLEYSIRIS